MAVNEADSSVKFIASPCLQGKDNSSLTAVETSLAGGVRVVADLSNAAQ